MLGYIIRRALFSLVTIFLVSILSFAIIQLPPGDYVDSYIAQLQASGTPVSTSEAENLRARYGLDEPFAVQYGLWMRQVLRGNLGTSMQWQRPVREVIGDRLALTMVVSVAALVFTWMIALPIGIFSAVRQYSVADYIATTIGFMGLAVPNFLFALVVMYIGWSVFGLNVGGLFSAEYELQGWSFGKFLNLLSHLPVPAIVLGTAATAQGIRVLRNNLLDELRKPYVVTARAKGLSETRLILKYPVRVALNPLASTIGYMLPFIVSGSVIVSIVLSLPTVGPVLLTSLQSQDMFLAGAIVLLLGVMTIIGTFLSDMLLLLIDPRIRMED
ncbi:MAG: ABC transporter permease [Sphaerobacteraceae bacterium]|nr:MAG: ABC transporter permease [Sphaerobacteraceae bacterium]